MYEDPSDKTGDSAWIKTPFGFSGGAKGRHITHLFYVTLLAIAILFSVWMHEQNTKERAATTQRMVVDYQTQMVGLMKRFADKQDEQTYVLSKSEQERKSLNLQMPDSLRSKVNRQ